MAGLANCLTAGVACVAMTGGAAASSARVLVTAAGGVSSPTSGATGAGVGNGTAA